MMKAKEKRVKKVVSKLNIMLSPMFDLYFAAYLRRKRKRSFKVEVREL